MDIEKRGISYTLYLKEIDEGDRTRAAPGDRETLLEDARGSTMRVSCWWRADEAHHRESITLCEHLLMGETGSSSRSYNAHAAMSGRVSERVRCSSRAFQVRACGDKAASKFHETS